MSVRSFRFFVSVFFTVILTLILGRWIPFYGSLIAAVIIPVFYSRRLWEYFLIVFLGVFMTWFAVSLYYFIGDENGFSGQVAELFGLNNELLMVFLTAMVGGLSAGMLALSVGALRSLILYKRP